MTITENHIDLAHAIATQMRSCFPSYIDPSDLRAAAEFGLVQAAHSFDDRRDVAFTTFAYYRIRGAILDFLRETARISTVERQAQSYSEDRGEGLTNPSGLGARSQPAQTDRPDNVISFPVTRSGVAEPVHHPNCCERLIRKEQRQMVRQAIQQLPRKNRELLEAYYFGELTLEDIGAQMGLSKSWISRLHAKSISLLREELARHSNHEAKGGSEEKKMPFPVPMQLRATA